VAPAKRQVDLAAISSLAPVAALLPTWAIAIAIFWLPFWKFTDVSFPLFAFAALSLGIILFSKSIQKLFLARLLGARQPTYEESVALYQAWRRVAKANHISTSSFLLAVVDSNELNAFASGGHLLVVSSFAVNELDNNELTGVLAHELSHHLGSHTVALTVAQWLSLPILLLARTGFILQTIAEAISDTLGSRLSIVKFFGILASAALTIVSSIFVSGLLVAQTLSNAVGYSSEFQADRRVVHMGFGRELLHALSRVADQTNYLEQFSHDQILVSSHPPARERATRLEALLQTEDPFR
jgi:Zn-dependent protease with chaperone function